MKSLAQLPPLVLAAALPFAFLPTAVVAQTFSQVPGATSFDAAVLQAQSLAPLETLLVSLDGKIMVDAGFHGHSTTRPTNIKSASKSIVSALVGIAIDKGLLTGTDQPIAPLLADRLPRDPDPRLAKVTIGHLLSMQAGLERTSGPNYGAWIASRDWVRAALAKPFVDEPGGRMLYSTGSTHLLSAILTKVSGRPTMALARDWLGEPAGVSITAWERDPQGIYLGGNQMAMTPRSLLAFGELYRAGGRNTQGVAVIPQAWVDQSFEPRTTSQFSGEAYGYGWFQAEFAGHVGHYGWGYGGQMIYVLPDLGLTVAITSNEDSPSARTEYKEALHRLVADAIVPVAEASRQRGPSNAVETQPGEG